jgi:thermolysin
MHKNKTYFLVSLVFIGLAAYGFRPDEWPTDRDSKGAGGTARPVIVRQPTDAQLQAAARLQDVDVQWDKKTGAPLSIRGKILGTLNLGGKGLTAAGEGNFAQDAIAVLDSLTDVYGIKDAQKEFAVFRVDSDNIGFHHARVCQMFQGLRVVGGELIVHFNKANQAYQVNGRYISGIAVNIMPALKPEEAVAKAQADLKTRGKPEGTLQGKSELVVFADNSTPKLAFELVLTYNAAKGTIPGHWVYTVDAISGQILNAFNSIPAVAATITGNRLTREGGESVSITGSLLSGVYYLQSGLWLIHNYDKTGSFTDSNLDAQRTTADWGTTDRIEISGAYNFNLVQSYYFNVYGRNSYDNSWTKATVNVHYDYGTTYNNAFWLSSAQEFFFYDGDGVSMSGLTVTDIAGHEFTHAVTEYSASLRYQNEPGALNESFSDIFGALVEFYYQPDGRGYYPYKHWGYADWLIAEDCVISATAWRDMRNPSSTTTLASGSQQPSKYQGAYWYSGSSDNGGVHINSGVQNFFFYLLCEGGGGTNDGISYNVTGIGIDNAARVAYRALTVYCTANTDYAAIRTAWVSAAQDLNSSWVESVQLAWNAVGITVQYTPLVADFDGDRFGDPTLYDPETGYWYIRLSQSGYGLCYFRWGAWGGNSTLHALADDFDGDRKADPALYDSSLYSASSGDWFFLLSSCNYQPAYLEWGWIYAPACADFDGDRLADPALYADTVLCYHSGFYVRLSSDGYERYSWSLGYYSYVEAFSLFGGNFDGEWWFDGKWYADTALYSNAGMWYITTGYPDFKFIGGFSFGAPGYTPALGDFDGDGLSDPTLRSATGDWFILLSSTGYQNYFSFSW